MKRFLPVPHVHQPAETENDDDKIPENVEAVAETLVVCVPSDNPEHNRREKSEQQRRLEMTEVQRHQGFAPLAISKASTMAKMFSRPAQTRNFVP